jgi:hypothetical protein
LCAPGVDAGTRPRPALGQASPASRVRRDAATLTLGGLRDLIVGVPTSQIDQEGNVSIQGDHRRGHALLEALSQPVLLDLIDRLFTNR